MPSCVPGMPFYTPKTGTSTQQQMLYNSVPTSFSQQTSQQQKRMAQSTPRAPSIGSNSSMVGLPASLVMPILAQVAEALTCQFNLAHGLDPFGWSKRILPMEKCKKLRKYALEILDYITEMEKKIVSLQFKLDDIQVLQGKISVALLRNCM